MRASVLTWCLEPIGLDGEDGTVLFFAARASVYRIPTKTRGSASELTRASALCASKAVERGRIVVRQLAAHLWR